MGDGGYGLKPSFEIYNLYVYNVDDGNEDDAPGLQCRKVLFKHLIGLPKREKSKQPRKKVFKMHLCSSPENQEIIRNTDKISKRKEELAKAKSEAYKRFLEEEKQEKKELVRKKKVTVRSDKVQARSMPAPVTGRGRDRGRCSVTNPKL